MHGTNDGVIEGKEQAMSKNQESTKKSPERPITGKEWIEGYRKWKKENEAYKADEDYKKILNYSIQMKAKKLLDEIK